MDFLFRELRGIERREKLNDAEPGQSGLMWRLFSHRNV